MDRLTRTVRIRRALGESLARLIGYKPYTLKINSEQIAWAKSREQADTIKWGNSVYKFLPYILRKLIG